MISKPDQVLILSNTYNTAQDLSRATDSLLSKLVIKVAAPLINTGIAAIQNSKSISPDVKLVVQTGVNTTIDEAVAAIDAKTAAGSRLRQDATTLAAQVLKPTLEVSQKPVVSLITNILPLIIRGIIGWIF